MREKIKTALRKSYNLDFCPYQKVAACINDYVEASFCVFVGKYWFKKVFQCYRGYKASYQKSNNIKIIYHSL